MRNAIQSNINPLRIQLFPNESQLFRGRWGGHMQIIGEFYFPTDIVTNRLRFNTGVNISQDHFM